MVQIDPNSRSRSLRVHLIFPHTSRLKDRAYEDTFITRILRLAYGLGRTNYIPPMQLLALAAVTPSDVDLAIVDERVEEIDYDDDVDLVGITVTTRVAFRAYEIASEYRRRGVAVVVGGVHPSLAPKEALQHADSVVVGEGESVWPQLLADFQNGELKPLYRGEPVADLSSLGPFPRNLLDATNYLTLKVTQATRGCPNSCRFCSSGLFGGGKRYRTRPVHKVVAELRQVPGKLAVFLDDNLGWDVEYTKSLFRALVPLNIYWWGTLTLSALEDTELLDLAAQSGCIALGVGFESISPEVIGSIGKRQTNHPDRYKELIQRLHRRGILVEGFFIIGFDEEGPGDFDRLADFIDECNIEIPCLHILLPYPGTAIARQFEREGRLLHKNWSHYDPAIGSVVYQPKQMSPEELREGYLRIKERILSLRSILKRLGRSPHLGFTMFAFHNNLQWRRVYLSERSLANLEANAAGLECP